MVVYKYRGWGKKKKSTWTGFSYLLLGVPSESIELTGGFSPDSQTGTKTLNTLIDSTVESIVLYVACRAAYRTRYLG